MAPEGAGHSKTLGFRVSSFDRQCGGDRPRGQSMAATAQLYLGLYVRVFPPLAKLGPLRALTASARALSETLGFIKELETLFDQTLNYIISLILFSLEPNWHSFLNKFLKFLNCTNSTLKPQKWKKNFSRVSNFLEKVSVLETQQTSKLSSNLTKICTKLGLSRSP